MWRNLILTIVFLLVGAGVFFFWTMPLYNKMSEANAAVASAQGRVEQVRNLLDLITEMEKQFGAMEKDIQKIEVAIPKEEQLPELLVSMPLLVSQSGLTLNGISFSEPLPEQDYQAVTIQLGTTGSYIAVQNFLQALEQNLRIMDVVSFQFSVLGGKDNYSLGMIVKTYFR
jgi:Tfp pilus assembly protein PilO